MEKIKSYYSVPTMVSFIDPDSEVEEGTVNVIYGIAFQDYIICGCCGGVFNIENLIEDFEAMGKDFDPEFEELDWVPFDEYIM